MWDLWFLLCAVFPGPSSLPIPIPDFKYMAMCYEVNAQKTQGCTSKSSDFSPDKHPGLQPRHDVPSAHSAHSLRPASKLTSIGSTQPLGHVCTVVEMPQFAVFSSWPLYGGDVLMLDLSITCSFFLPLYFPYIGSCCSAV